MNTEADTCRKYVLPKLYSSGWSDDQICEQRTFTDGRIVVIGRKVKRRDQQRADYLLKYRRDFTIAVDEAKPEYKTPADGLQQAKNYADILGLKFAYSTNGHAIVEFDFTTGEETILESFPSPNELWQRYQRAEGMADHLAADRLLTPYYAIVGKTPRYYQEIAINRAVLGILKGGKRRFLLTLATGTGKTLIAFQVCWKLWNASWNRTGEHRRPRILYLSDRNILVDDPKDKMFGPFGDARHKIENGEIVKSREMYFAIYQAIAANANRPGYYREYSRDFFDVIVVDECHRGSARDDSCWREILEYFEPAFQIGMTATPLREETRDTYKYFGNPIYTYSLRQGIDDGFLAPYRVHRVITAWDAAGWRVSQGELDRFGREIPDEEYHTKDFERMVALRARTHTIARHLTEFMKKNGRFGKTIVFCVDQEHADEMRRELNNLNADLALQFPDFACRVTAEEGSVGRGHLSRFQDIETRTPVILTTSKLLTTGVDAPMVRNVVLASVIGSMTEFKQIIGRGTRICIDGGKYFFNIIDYTGSATQHFADLEFDGEPSLLTQEELDENGNPKSEPKVIIDKETDDDGDTICEPETPYDGPAPPPRKYYYDGGQVEIVAHLVYELDSSGKQLRVVKYSDYAAQTVRIICRSPAEIRQAWADPVTRAEIISKLEERGISFDELAAAANQPNADPFDLLCHVAFNAPLRTRRERAERLRKEMKDFFDNYGSEARVILNELLEKYAEHGDAQFQIPDVLEIPPISAHGNVMEIIVKFGGADKLREAVARLQALLYAA